uniref:Homocysteine-responsive endoplasmic reticulum-resident ubiquitin-like domain member 2 protein n=1 Tax=Cacopsylla melanoneura TaxID=428564 RepID=A0A8D9BB16_9HEMI
MDRETSEEVTIVVKSPYQMLPDQEICCSTEWTVEQLKEEIMHLCPNKPSVKEQKLIYWGKLLDNKTKLKDTLKIYEEGQSNHTVHLVIKNDQSYAKADGLRKRGATAQSSSTSSSSPLPSSASTTPLSSPSFPSPPDPRYYPNIWSGGPAYFFGQAAAPAYGNVGANQNGANVGGGGGVGEQFAAYNQDHMVQITAMQQAYVQYMQQYMQMMMGGGAMLHQATPPFMQAPPPRPGPQVQHVPDPNENQADNPGEGRPRDWLDWFYLSSRALIFLTIVCFYSSPFRFLLVLVIGFAIYLYQSGFFRYPGPAILIGNNDPAPPPRPADDQQGQNNEPNPRPQSNSETSPSAASEASPSENTNESDSPTARRESSPDAATVQNTTSDGRLDEERPTLLTLTWSIVANFFASLLPEQPAII